MKASPLRVRSKSNLGVTDTIEMSFDPKGQVKLAAILIDLYSDIWAAILREYAANGWDSHVSAGQKRPIEVTLPTINDRVLRFRDYGLGMDMHDIGDIYSKYGASTKDNDNDQIGSYGLGCKSALSVSPSFTVTAIKNGIKNVVIVSREENSLGRITPVLQIETDEPNGVGIAIPVDASPQDFASKAENVFFTWPKGSVLIDGKPPVESIYDESKFLDLGNKAFMSHEKCNGYSYGGSEQGLLVNMGGIGYPVNDIQYRLLLDTARRRDSVSAGALMEHKLIITVPMGDIDLIPSREGIRWTKKSTDTVVEKLTETMGLIVSSIQKKINLIENREELFCKDLFQLGKSFPSYFQDGTLTWNNEKFPQVFELNPISSSAKPSYNCGAKYKNSRLSKGYIGPTFNFGFNNRSETIEISESGSFNSQWVFIDCRDSELSPSDLHNQVKSLIKSRSLGISVNVVYMVDDNLPTNKWLMALFNQANNNIMSITVDELIAEATEYRKSQARKSRQNIKTAEPVYTVSVVKGSVEDRKRIDTTMKASEIKEMVEQNPEIQVFADEVIFSTANSEHSMSAMFFLPDNALIVYMRGARKASAFVKNVDFDVRVDLADYLAENMVQKIEQLDFKEYFSELHMGYDICNFGSLLNLPEGFLKECCKGSKRYSPTRLILEHMNQVKKIDGAVFPEIDYVIKSRKILEIGALFFEDPQHWTLSRRSNAYRSQMESYLIGISDKIDNIVYA